MTKQAVNLKSLCQVKVGASSQKLQSPMAIPTRRGPRTEVTNELTTSKAITFRYLVNKPGIKAQTLFPHDFLSGQQGEAANSFLATLASSSSEEMEAELQERVESSQKQANHVVEIYERLKSTVDQLKAELDSGAGELN